MAIIFLNIQLSVSLLLSLLFIILIYASLNTFRFPENNLNYCYPHFVYKRSYWLLFWTILIIHIIIYIFFIIKPHLFIINKEVIAEYFGIQFVQYFTIEEKMKYFKEYFDHYMTAGNASDTVINTLTVYIEAIDINNIIVESTKMNDIKFFIDDLVENYVKHVTIIHAQYVEYLEILAQKTWLLGYRDRLLNMVNFYVFWNVIIMYLDAFSLVKVLPLDPRMYTLICAWIDLIIRNRR